MRPRQMLGVGVGILGTLGVLVQAGRAWSVEVVPPPVASSRPLAAAERTRPPPPRPVVPQLMPPSHLSPTEAILWEIREVCQLLKQPDMTVTGLATRIGDVTYEGESMGMVVRPASRYFSEAQVTRDQDLDGNWLPEVPDDVTLSLAESRQLPMSALESAFGKGKWYMIFDAPYARPLYFRWRSQPAGPIRCWIGAENDESNDYGHKKGVVTAVTIQRTTIK